MKRNNVLLLGYGIDADRLEAVSINALRLEKQLRFLGYSVKIQNIGFNDPDFATSMLQAVLTRETVIHHLLNVIDVENITIIHDLFVLPAATLLFTLRLKKLRPHLRIIKEVHNDAGFSHVLHPETFIRMLANTHGQLQSILHNCEAYTRNKYLAEKYNIPYLPQPVQILPFQRKHSDVIRIGYLGHALKKKGIYVFPELIRLFGANKNVRTSWEFAFSGLESPIELKQSLIDSANQENSTISFSQKVLPHDFFSRQDFYVLPLQDQFGAISTPNTILEAMEAGAIPVVTAMDSLKGIVQDSKNAILIPYPNAAQIYSTIQGMLKNVRLQSLLRKNARAFIQKNFDERMLLRKLQTLYASKKDSNSNH